MPFEENSFLEFLGIFACNYIFGVVQLAISVLITTLFVTMGLFFKSVRKHFEFMFQNMSDLVCEPPTPNYVVQLKASLIEAINLHNRVNE